MIKASDIAGFLGGLVIVALVAAAIVWRVSGHPGSRTASAVHPPPPPAPAALESACEAREWRAAASANAGSLTTLAWSPFGRPETGWQIYAPLIGREIGVRCGPTTPGFAAAYARWQTVHGLVADGVVKAADFGLLRDAWALRRPFVQQTAKGLCPAAPVDTALATADPAETYGGRPIQLREGALAAYRRMLAAARADRVAHGDVLKLVSGFRGPAEETERCLDAGCNTLTRAHCSAHRTGLALDLFLDHEAGQDPTSTADANRAAMVRTPAYRWLVLNADRFGFLPYPFEPWHWEWTGEAP